MTIEEAREKVTNDSGVYYFRNKINGKYYIGQAFKLRKRFIHHLSNYKNSRYNAPLYKAMEEYGLDNFEYEIIQTCNNNDYAERQKELDKLETKFIEEYNSYGSTGYNQTKGGDHDILGFKMNDEQKEKIRQAALLQNQKTKKTICARPIEGSLDSWQNLTYNRASQLSDVHINVVKRIINDKYGKYHAKGWVFAPDIITLNQRWADLQRLRAAGLYNANTGKFVKGHTLTKGKSKKPKVYTDVWKNRISESLHKYIFQKLDLNGNVIKEYYTCKEAALDIHSDTSSIYQVCRGRSATIKGYKFRRILKTKNKEE